MITLKQYTNEENQILPLIQGFWKAHSHYDQSGEEAQEDLTNWTKDGHIIYFIQHDETTVGFAHVGSRGGKIDWLAFYSAGISGKRFRQRSDSPVGRNCKAVFCVTLH